MDLVLASALSLIVGIVLMVTIRVAVAPMQRRRCADKRARALLERLLTPGELDGLRTFGYLEISSRTTPGRRYRIPAEPGPITVIDGGAASVRLCIVPTLPIPQSEQVLVRKLMLEGDEAEVWMRANRLRALPCPFEGRSDVEFWMSLDIYGLL